MTITEIPGIGQPLDPLKGKKEKKAEASGSASKDQVELSEEARSLYEAEQSKRLEKIHERIRQGFYFQREVTEKIVEEMLKDLQKLPAS